MIAPLTSVTQALEIQAGVCARMGSPFSALVARTIAADIAADGCFASLAEKWEGHDLRRLFADAAALRLIGGMHYLALTGRAPDLAARYPPAQTRPDPDELAGLLVNAAAAHSVVLSRFIESPPQTNEVNRSVCLVGGFLAVARRTGLPLRCLEIGASAGLNLNWDRYHYALGAFGAWGDVQSPVRLGSDWSGAAPPFEARASVMERKGCDQNPINVAVPDEALRLKAYVWPDQTMRMTRLDGAIALARRYPTRPDKADAADWTRTHAHPVPGAATVIYHSVVWQYLPEPTQADIAASILASGESASDEAPFAWLRMEPNPADMTGPMELKLTFWPGGDETLLARVHPHGATVFWTGD